jgi:signal peptidase I
MERSDTHAPEPQRPISSADRDAALREANRQHSGFRLSWVWEWAKVFPAAVLLFFLMKTMLIEAYKIPSGSMERTLMVGDFLLVNKWVYGAEIPLSERHLPAIRSPKRGDVIVFEWPVDPTKNFVKRLVGLPGDTLSMRRGSLLLNGVAQKEPYIEHSEPGTDPDNDDFRWQRTSVLSIPSDSAPLGPSLASYHPTRDNWGPLLVPPNSFFVLGDNRDNSLDSRYWGFVPDSMLRGTPLVVYYSYAPDSTASAPWLTRIRWSRLGEAVR